jgi:hypothetical protein
MRSPFRHDCGRLASHRVVELLPERSAEAVGTWLARHQKDRAFFSANSIS